jgi:hypothetical protein
MMLNAVRRCSRQGLGMAVAENVGKDPWLVLAAKFGNSGLRPLQLTRFNGHDH